MIKLRQKLKSESGASIVIALVFFLLCLTVGAVVLTAASANAGRVKRIEGEQQAYFAVRSAAELLRDEIEGSSFEALYEKYMSGENAPGRLAQPHYTLKGLDEEQLPSLFALIRDDAKNVFQARYEGASAEERSAIWTVAAPDMPRVTVQYRMDEAYGMTLALDTEDTHPYHSPMVLAFSPILRQTDEERTVSWTTTSQGTDEAGNPVTETVHHEMTVRHSAVTASWTAGEIRKGRADEA